MDKSAIKNFAIEARKILMKSAISEAGLYGVTKDGCKPPVQKGNDFEIYETIAGTQNRIFGSDIKKRANLVQAIEQLGFDQVIEETAYTWFNRIIAIRFMEINNYLPTRVRVLSSETGSSTPDIVAQSDTVDLNMTEEELQKVRDAKNDNKYDEAFRQLFVKQCNELNAILPGLFEKTNDYMELLLKLSYTGDGVVRMLIDTIPEDNFNVETEGQVEIIGWMYQYYNTELKDDTFAKLKKNVKITKERIPAATQLFTPDWIVRYMVENSVGRVWIEHLRAVDSSVDEKAKAEEFGWKYYLPEAEQDAEVTEKLVEIRKDYVNLELKDITCIDPCMGSGHILVYMFDVLMDIYRSEGYNERDAVFSILQNNIRGLDIDRRAYQLSYFALMMKARGYNRLFFRGMQNEDGGKILVEPCVFAIEESNNINRQQLSYFGYGLSEIEKNNALNQIEGMLDALVDSKEYGSTINMLEYDWKLLYRFVEKEGTHGQITFDTVGIENTQRILIGLIKISEVLAAKYLSVVTNPPYMGCRGGMNAKLYDFVTQNYPDSKTDLYSVFIEKCQKMTRKNGFCSMITQQGWMFLTSFSLLRAIILEKDIVNLLHLGPRAFDEISGEVVQSVTFTIRKSNVPEYKASYSRLLDGNGEKQKRDLFLSEKCQYQRAKETYGVFEERQIAYWLSDNMYNVFSNKQLGEYAKPRQGMATSDNNRFLRLWYEVDRSKIELHAATSEAAVESGAKWFPYNKGGGFRKWYGNNDYLINWENDGEEVKKLATELYKCVTRTIKNIQFYFKPGITWSTLASGAFNARCFSEGFLFDTKGSSCYFDNPDDVSFFAGLLNSNVANELLKVLAPTLDYNAGSIAKIPVIVDATKKSRIEELVKQCCTLSKEDWDQFETSWDFEKNPLCKNVTTIEESYKLWNEECNKRFKGVKAAEEELNQIFTQMYNLETDLDPKISDEAISIHLAVEKEDIKAFISYAVGCMLGRYSLDREGIVFAGGKFDVSEYKSYSPDCDGIIPITDSEYFSDDIVARFVSFVSCVFGENALEDNLNFISSKLGIKGNSSRDILRKYFLDEFYKDHCNTYSVTGAGKRPIYWLFDAGKQNGFKCLIYLHRYTKDTVGVIRTDYLTKVQNAIENAQKNAEYVIQTSGSAVDRAQATKQRDKYIKQLAELRTYYQALSHVAQQRIELDLDDGVKVNYAKFQGIEVSIEGEKKQTINLLAKI